jgi:hypothetical protein
MILPVVGDMQCEWVKVIESVYHKHEVEIHVFLCGSA